MLSTVGTIVCEGREEVAVVVADHGDGRVNLLIIDCDGRTRTEYAVSLERFMVGGVPCGASPPKEVPFIVDGPAGGEEPAA